MILWYFILFLVIIFLVIIFGDSNDKGRVVNWLTFWNLFLSCIVTTLQNPFDILSQFFTVIQKYYYCFFLEYQFFNFWSYKSIYKKFQFYSSQRWLILVVIFRSFFFLYSGFWYLLYLSQINHLLRGFFLLYRLGKSVIYRWRFSPLTFFYKAFFSIYVTFQLFRFIYLVYYDLPLGPALDWKKIRRLSRLPWFLQTFHLPIYRFLYVLFWPYLLINASFWRWVSHYGVSYKSRLRSYQTLFSSTSESFYFLRDYYKLNDLIWQDGFLLDFLQKKFIDRWVRTFVIYSGYLFSERVLFDVVVRFYIDYIVWPSHAISIYEFKNVSGTLTFTLFLLMGFFIIVSFYYFSTLIL